MTEKLRATMACAVTSPAPLHFIEDTIVSRKLSFTKCIGNFVRESWYHWIDLYSEYKRGLLPYPGTIQEQPNKAIEIFRAMDMHYMEIALKKKRQQGERERRKAGRGR